MWKNCRCLINNKEPNVIIYHRRKTIGVINSQHTTQQDVGQQQPLRYQVGCGK